MPISNENEQLKIIKMKPLVYCTFLTSLAFMVCFSNCKDKADNHSGENANIPSNSIIGKWRYNMDENGFALKGETEYFENGEFVTVASFAHKEREELNCNFIYNGNYNRTMKTISTEIKKVEVKCGIKEIESKVKEDVEKNEGIDEIMELDEKKLVIKARGERKSEITYFRVIE